MAEYVPGLEGVVAAQTEISLVDGANGQLVYRGYVIADLAEEMSFEEFARERIPKDVDPEAVIALARRHLDDAAAEEAELEAERA